MKFSMEELAKIEFKDPFDFEKLKTGQESAFIETEACCYVCGDELQNLAIGFNKKEQLYRCECSNCGVIYVVHDTSDITETVIVQGKERNWPEYLSKTLKFPFYAMVSEDDGRSFFNPDYEGLSIYNTVKVLNVHYSIKYGVVAEVQKSNLVYLHTLCFLDGLDDHSHVELENYKRWRKLYWLSDFLGAIAELEGDD